MKSCEIFCEYRYDLRRISDGGVAATAVIDTDGDVRINLSIDKASKLITVLDDIKELLTNHLDRK